MGSNRRNCFLQILMSVLLVLFEILVNTKFKSLPRSDQYPLNCPLGSLEGIDQVTFLKQLFKKHKKNKKQFKFFEKFKHKIENQRII